MNSQSLSGFFLSFLLNSVDGFFEQAQIWIESESPIPCEASNLAKESGLSEPPDEAIRSRRSAVEPIPNCSDGYQWMVEELVHDTVSIASGSAQIPRDDATVLFPHLQDC